MYILDTWIEWETVWISAWVHGNEHAWVQALKDFKSMVEKDIVPIYKWKVILILEWNEEALAKNKRCIDDDSDLNRVINGVPSGTIKQNYEQNRWKEIKRLMDQFTPDQWLDLHTVSSPKAKPYLFSWTQWYSDLAKKLGIQNIAINWANIHKLSGDIHWVVNQGLADYINHIWGNGFTFEAWNHNSPDWAVNSYQSIINFLVTLDMTKPFQIQQVNKEIDEPKFLLEWVEWIVDIWNEEQSNHVHMEYYHTFSWGFRYIDWIPYSFSKYKQGDIIWYDILENWDEIEVKAEFDGYIILPKDPEICIEWKEVFFYWKDINKV